MSNETNKTSDLDKQIKKIRIHQVKLLFYIVLLLGTAVSIALWTFGVGNFEATVILFMTCIFAKDDFND